MLWFSSLTFSLILFTSSSFRLRDFLFSSTFRNRFPSFQSKKDPKKSLSYKPLISKRNRQAAFANGSARIDILTNSSTAKGTGRMFFKFACLEMNLRGKVNQTYSCRHSLETSQMSEIKLIRERKTLGRADIRVETERRKDVFNVIIWKIERTVTIKQLGDYRIDTFFGLKQDECWRKVIGSIDSSRNSLTSSFNSNQLT